MTSTFKPLYFIKKHLLLLVCFFVGFNLFAQYNSYADKGFNYMFPFPGATEVSLQNNIIIKHDIAFSPDIDGAALRLYVKPNEYLPSCIKFAEGGHTLLMQPTADLPLNTIIHLEIDELLLTNGTHTEALRFSFKTRTHPLFLFSNEIHDALHEEAVPGSAIHQDFAPRQIEGIQFPVDYPKYYFHDFGNTKDDNFYFEGATIGNTYHQLMFDQDNIPYFYRKTASRTVDFKINQNGYPTFFDVDAGHFVEYDSAYDFQRTYACGNGYITDFHDILVLENGHYYTIGLEFLVVDMSQYISCGLPNATVRFNVIQELDENDNVVFQWRTFDHFNIMDGDSNQVNFCAQNVNYCHVNSVALDASDNIIISSRHMNEVTKINSQNGEIIWRFGGKNNMFTLMNDPKDGFLDQHSAREVEPNIISLFDNSSTSEHLTSRGVKYEVDTNSWTANMLIEYENDPPVLCFFAGHMQETENGQVILGWAYNSQSATASEFNSDASRVLDITYDTTIINNSYRSFKFPWKTTYFTAKSDTLDFGNQNLPGQTYTETVGLSNPRDHEVIITGSHINSSIFFLESELPFSIPAHGEDDVEVGFKPIFDGVFKAKLTLISQLDSCGISVQIRLQGSTLESDVAENNDIQTLEIFPNPFSEVVKLQIQSESDVDLKVYNMQGILMYQDQSMGKVAYSISTEDWDSGLYIFQFRSRTSNFSRKLLKTR